VYIPAVVGNHGRIDKKPRAKNRVYDNYDWLAYQLLKLKRHFAGGKSISFGIADGADQVFTVHNTSYLLTHGDQFRGGSGISGVMSPLFIGDARKRKRQMAVRCPYDYMGMGHWHTYLKARGVIVNGSLKGRVSVELRFRSADASGLAQPPGTRDYLPLADLLKSRRGTRTRRRSQRLFANVTPDSRCQFTLGAVQPLQQFRFELCVGSAFLVRIGPAFAFSVHLFHRHISV
jgi:hypothetical protein